ncbi:MAG: outer membrane beta-barrel protein [Bacteroidota bacterium]
MEKIILVIFTLLPLTIIGQISDTTKTKGIAVGLTFSPDYCYRTLIPDNSNLSKGTVDLRDSIEIPKIGFSAGVSVFYEFSKRINIEIGLQFSDKGKKIEIDYSELTFGDLIDTRYGFVYSISGQDLPASVTVINKYQHLDFPVKVNYSIISKKMKFFLTTGISTNVFLAYKTTAIKKYSDGKTERNTSSSDYYDFSKVNFAFIGGLGMEYTLANKLGFRLEPIYRRSINSIIDAPIKSYLYSFGINIGIFYKLGV